MTDLPHVVIGSFSNLVVSVGAFLIVLTIVVTIHELGHFLMAKSFGVAIDRFSIGFGKPIFSRVDKSGVEWRIGSLPLGGYVRFTGDADASSSVPDAEDLNDLRQQVVRRQGEDALRRYFHFKPIYQRALVVAAGPAANFVLSIFLFTVFAAAIGINVTPPRIGAVNADSAAASAGLQRGDLITAIDGRAINDFKDVVAYVHLRANDPLKVSFERGGMQKSTVVTPRRVDVTDPVTRRSMQIGRIGVLPMSNSTRLQLSPVEAVRWGAGETWNIVATTVTYLGRIVSGKESASQLSSFLGMAQTAGSVVKDGADSSNELQGKAAGVALNLLSFTALVSTAVGFMNLLPVPVLDGGHLVFYAYEAVAQRPLGAKFQAASYRIGLALLIGLMLFATWNDIQQRSIFNLLGLSS
jgi:regulator of sigma E protease